ncbi:MAG: methyltransferase domain-containing protein [Bacteriovoracaceae bacterium]|nr:methyltransferase domain-containing protein [Bacteriovoracaceae bacterium]
MHQEVQEYYGKELKESDDLKTNACCTLEPPPNFIKEAMSLVHDEVHRKYYGCGLAIPSELAGLKVLDLGSGSGRDAYITSKLVGESGEVVGLDMTDEQLLVANKYVDYHTEKFSYQKPNISFIKGNIDEMEETPLKNDYFDLIISNCVINLCKNKEKVLRDCFNKLKSGGEFYFSDVYASRRISAELQADPVLYGECLSGALYWNDFLKIAKAVGFRDARCVSKKPITIENDSIKEKLEGTEFYSLTYRLFKVDGLEDDCEDYGQSVAYKGTISEQPTSFDLDGHHNFEKAKLEKVCGNTFLMLKNTRFEKHFDFYGTFDDHYGIFPGCGSSSPFEGVSGKNSTEGSCC